MRHHRRAALALLALVVGASAPACGGGGAGSGAGEGGLGTVTVLAASSLTDAFAEVARAFEDDHPGASVELAFDASSRLATQIVEGVVADVFVSADRASVEPVVDAGLAAGAPVAFAANRLQIVVAAGNPLEIEGLADLGTGLRLALCAPEAPCGRYSAEAFARAGLAVPEASEEANVRGVLTKVRLGEADAGLVYATDVMEAAAVDGVDLAPDEQVAATYVAVALEEAPNPGGAAAFLAYLTEPAAQEVLARHEFEAP